MSMFDDKMGELRLSAHPLTAKRRAVQTKTPRTKAMVRQRNAYARGREENEQEVSERKDGKRERETHHHIVGIVTHRGEDDLFRREDEDDTAAGETERGQCFGRRTGGENGGGRLWKRKESARDVGGKMSARGQKNDERRAGEAEKREGTHAEEKEEVGQEAENGEAGEEVAPEGVNIDC